MKTLLLFPPAADPAHPPLGIASLAGYLEARGRQVELLDLNVLAYHRLLASESLRRCAGRMEARVAELEAGTGLAPEQAAEYRLLVENLLSAEYLADAVADALDALRDPTTYASRSRYARSSSLLRRSMELVSAAHYPVRWYPRGFSTSWLPTRSRDVLSAVADPDQNLFLPLVEETLERLAESPPEVLGISVNYYCQVIPGMTVAAVARRVLPGTRIVVGGGLMCFFDGRWGDLAPFAPLVDAWIPWEGELPLDGLLEALHRGDDPGTVPGVLVFRDGEAALLPPEPSPDPRRLPPPSFDGLPLEDYLSPEPVLPMLASRGCYWTRCAFCSHYQLFRQRFRTKTAEQVREEMEHLAGRYGCGTFYLSDEAIPPRVARGLAAEVRRDRLPFRWFGESRFERYLEGGTPDDLAAGGCRMLMFGLESAVPRILERMEKGIDPDRARRILLACHGAGIRAFVMFFLGFPGETETEAETTLRFVEGLRGPITHVAFSNFILEHQSPVYRDPGRYGITAVLPYEDEDLKIYSDYRVSEGLSPSGAVDLLERARERRGIRTLVDLYLVSRSHLVFLPPLEEVREDSTDLEAADLLRLSREEGEDHLFPHRAPDLVPRFAAFNLDHVRERLATGDGDGPPLPRHPTGYVFSPRRETLLEVGDEGLRLLAPCDGRFSLAQILEATGPGGRQPAFDFYAQLTRRGALEWEVRS